MTLIQTLCFDSRPECCLYVAANSLHVRLSFHVLFLSRDVGHYKLIRRIASFAAFPQRTSARTYVRTRATMAATKLAVEMASLAVYIQ